MIPTTAAGLAFVGYAAASLLWSPAEPLFAAVELASLALAYWIGTMIADPRRIWLWAIAFTTALIFANFLFPMLNSNIIGAIAAFAIAIALIYDWWIFVPIGTFGVCWSQSRLAVVAMLVILLVRLWRLAPVVVVIAGFAALALIYTKPFGISLYQRAGIWQDTLNHMSLLGSGFGSYAKAYYSFPIHTNMFITVTNHAYNDVLETIFELGIGSIFLWLLIALCLEAEGPKLHLLCLAILSLAFFSLSIPPLAQAFAFSLGNLSRRLPYGSLAPSCPSLS